MSRHQEVVLTGSVICPGIGIGRVEFVDIAGSVPHRELIPEAVRKEQTRYSYAVEAARRQVREHMKAIQHDIPEHSAVVIDIHNAILRDDIFHDSVRNRIASDLKNAEWALEIEWESFMAQFEAMRDPFLRTRVEDVRDVVTEVLDILIDPDRQHTQAVPSRSDVVLITPHLHPSAAMYAQRIGAVGFATESKVLTSHAAILLNGFGVPTVGGVDGLVTKLRDGDEVIVDAIRGRVVLCPSASTLGKYRTRQAKLRKKSESVAAIDCMTADGTKIRLLGNIGNPDQASLILQRGLDGVGLFRTEFLAMEDGTISTEDEQTATYRRVITALEGRSLVMRTFDIGGDKQISSLQVSTGRNPALGLRGIRRHLRRDSGEFRTQLRAMLRACADSDAGIMVPMVTTVDDVRKAKRRFEQTREELNTGGIACGMHVKFGVMIETPAAALQIAEILEMVDFVSLGSNDLLQYLMAADRDDEEVADYNDPDNPAFLWLLDFIITKARNLGREEDVSICGEIASRRHQISKLLHLGYRSFSIVPVMANDIREVIAKTNLLTGRGERLS